MFVGFLRRVDKFDIKPQDLVNRLNPLKFTVAPLFLRDALSARGVRRWKLKSRDHSLKLVALPLKVQQ
jgi:hypothetical protein